MGSRSLGRRSGGEAWPQLRLGKPGIPLQIHPEEAAQPAAGFHPLRPPWGVLMVILTLGKSRAEYLDT